MPYILDPNLEDEQNQQPAPSQPGQVQISGASPTTEPQGQGTGTSPKALNTGSGYQNLDSYLKTNDASAFGNQVLGKVSADVDTAKNNQATAATQFGQRIQDASQVPTADQINQAIANPTQADPTQYQAWENQSYTGPKSLSDTQDLWNQYYSGTDKANTQAQLLNTEPGRFTLLDSYFGAGKPNYTYGDKSLDNLLFQQSGVGAQTKDIQDQATELKSQGQAQALDLQNQAAQRSAAVDQSAAAARQAVGIDSNGQVITGDQAGALGKAQQQALDQLAQANADRQALAVPLQTALANGTLTDVQKRQLGIPVAVPVPTTPRGNNIGPLHGPINRDGSSYGVNPNDYFSVDTAPLDINQTLTPDQRAQIQALSQLAGITDTFASQAPEALPTSDPYSFNNANYTQAVNQAKSAYQNAAVQGYYANMNKYYPGQDGSNFQDDPYTAAAGQTPAGIAQIIGGLKNSYLVDQAGKSTSDLNKAQAQLYQSLAKQYGLPL